MREHLGWMTSCSNVQSCPQNWLECSVTEIPTEVRCHICQSRVLLVKDESTVRRVEREGRIAAFPVVPPVSMSPGTPMESASLARSPPPKAETRSVWICTLGSGESIRIDRAELVIGRSRSCDVVIPSAKVSRQHASLTLANGELWIEDLGSANGVFKDGEKVTRIQISDGETFSISDETLRFELR